MQNLPLRRQHRTTSCTRDSCSSQSCLAKPQGGTDWRSRLGIPGIKVTDAKSLDDHLQKTRSIPKEGQVMIHLLVVKKVENTVVKMKEVPTTHLLADNLTKDMPFREKLTVSSALSHQRCYHDALFNQVKLKKHVLLKK